MRQVGRSMTPFLITPRPLHWMMRLEPEAEARESRGPCSPSPLPSSPNSKASPQHPDTRGRCS